VRDFTVIAAGLSDVSLDRSRSRASTTDEDEFILPSDSEIETRSNKSSKSASSKGSSRRSAVSDEDEEEDFIVSDDDEGPRPKKGKAKGKPSTFGVGRGAAAKAVAGINGVGDSSSLSFLTAAERREKAKKDEKKAEETPYSFLQDIKDVCPFSAFFAVSDIQQKDGNRPGELGYDPRTIYIPKSAWNEFTPFEKQVRQNALSWSSKTNSGIVLGGTPAKFEQ